MKAKVAGGEGGAVSLSTSRLPFSSRLHLRGRAGVEARTGEGCSHLQLLEIIRNARPGRPRPPPFHNSLLLLNPARGPRSASTSVEQRTRGCCNSRLSGRECVLPHRLPDMVLLRYWIEIDLSKRRGAGDKGQLPVGRWPAAADLCAGGNLLALRFQRACGGGRLP